jgi:hypothetical protein
VWRPPTYVKGFGRWVVFKLILSDCYHRLNRRMHIRAFVDTPILITHHHPWFRFLFLDRLFLSFFFFASLHLMFIWFFIIPSYLSLNSFLLVIAFALCALLTMIMSNSNFESREMYVWVRNLNKFVSSIWDEKIGWREGKQSRQEKRVLEEGKRNKTRKKETHWDIK